MRPTACVAKTTMLCNPYKTQCPAETDMHYIGRAKQEQQLLLAAGTTTCILQHNTKPVLQMIAKVTTVHMKWALLPGPLAGAKHNPSCQPCPHQPPSRHQQHLAGARPQCMCTLTEALRQNTLQLQNVHPCKPPAADIMPKKVPD